MVDEYDSICSIAVFNVKDYFDERTKKHGNLRAEKRTHQIQDIQVH